MAVRLLAAALSAAVVLVLGALVILGEPPANTRLWREFFNAGHAPLFGVVAVTILLVVPLFTDATSIAFRRRYVLAAFTSILLGGATELIQHLIGRDAELGDLIRDAVGAISFLAIAASVDRSTKVGSAGAKARWVFRCGVGLLFLTSFISAASWTLAYLNRNSAFPTLASFETAAGSRFVSVENAALDRTHAPEVWRLQPNKMVGHITFYPSKYATVTLDEPCSDWKGYSTLVISLFSPRVDTISLVVRIEDRQHNGDFSDRFNAAYGMEPGPNRIQIPLDRIADAPATRPMDMSAIAGLALFVANPGDTMSLYLDSVYLY